MCIQGWEGESNATPRSVSYKPNFIATIGSVTKRGMSKT